MATVPETVSEAEKTAEITYVEKGYQTKLRMSAEVDKLFAAMSKAQGAMGGAKKDSQNPYFKSYYADLHSVIETSRKPLLDHGLCVIQTTEMDGDKIIVLTTLGHSSGQWIQGRTPVIYNKQTAQDVGSGITYARRYAWSAICGIAQMDDDAESTMNRSAANDSHYDLTKPTPPIKISPKIVKQVISDSLSCLSEGDDLGLKQIWAEFGPEEQSVLWGKFNSEQRASMKELLK